MRLKPQYFEVVFRCCCGNRPILIRPKPFWPVLTYPHLTCPDPSGPVLTYSDPSGPVLTCPYLSDLSWPVLACPDLFWPVLTCPILTNPHLIWTELSVCLLVCMFVTLWVKFKFIELFTQLKMAKPTSNFKRSGVAYLRLYLVFPNYITVARKYSQYPKVYNEQRVRLNYWSLERNHDIWYYGTWSCSTKQVNIEQIHFTGNM